MYGGFYNPNPFFMATAENPGQFKPAYQPQQSGQNGLIWVQGEAGAKSFLVAPGQSVLLMDSETQRFYLKSADQSGMPSMRVFEYTERLERSAAAGQQIMDPTVFVTREELEKRLAGLMKGGAENEQSSV